MTINSRNTDYYRILQVHPEAHPNVLRAAYIQLSKLYHPDVAKDIDSEERMKQLNIAHEVLKNPESRKKYDANYSIRRNELLVHGVPETITRFSAHRRKGLFTDKIVIYWEEPISDFPIVKYDLQGNNVYTDYKWIVLENDNNSAVIDKVITYAKYTFRIRAINSVGAGKWTIFKEGDRFVW